MPDEPAPKPPADPVQSRPTEASATASAHAPFVYFDIAPTYGCNAGVVNVTLEALRFQAVDNKVVKDRVVVAHLRMSVPAAQGLKQAIEGALLLAAPLPSTAKN